MLFRCGDFSVDLDLVWVELVTALVHTDWCWAGGGWMVVRYGDCLDVQNI